MTNTRPCILIADDESKIRRVVAANLEQNGFDVILTSDGEHTLEVLRHCTQLPDVIVLDLMMPGKDGLEVLQEIRQSSLVPIIMLTAKNEVIDKMTAFRLGADDYLTKPFSLEELQARIHAVLRRAKNSISSGAKADELTNGPLLLRYSSRLCSWNNITVKLSDIEFRLLWELLKHKGAILTHDALLRAVWGSEMIGELNTLRVTLARIRKKFSDAQIETNVITNFSKVGYMMSDLSHNV